MSEGTTEAAPDAQAFQACAEDATLLARLHDREFNGEELQSLAAAPAVDWFWLHLAGADAAEGFRLIDAWLARHAEDAKASVDELAADFADIYLTFAARVSPTESYWLTEDHIERQEPMFEVRRWFDHYGLSTADWRTRADDHLVSQLLFVAHLLQQGTTEALGDAAHFLDQHLLRWSQSFCAGSAKQASTEFYAGLALITEAWLQALRDELQRATGVPRAVIEETKRGETDAGAPAVFVPGSAPTW